MAAEQAWIGAFCQRVMELKFVLDEDINRPEHMAAILTSMDLPAEQLLQATP